MLVPGFNKPLAVMPGASCCIKDERNPFYKKKLAQVVQAVAVNGFSVPGEIARYLIAHGMLPDAGLKSLKGEDYGRKLQQDNLDFFARAYRREQH